MTGQFEKSCGRAAAPRAKGDLTFVVAFQAPFSLKRIDRRCANPTPISGEGRPSDRP